MGSSWLKLNMETFMNFVLIKSKCVLTACGSSNVLPKTHCHESRKSGELSEVIGTRGSL